MISIALSKSEDKTKKLNVKFYDKSKLIKSVDFGAKGYSDYTKHKDDRRKDRYLKRHIKNEDWNNYMTAGSLSRYILWNKKTLKDSIIDYSKRFKLKILNPL